MPTVWWARWVTDGRSRRALLVHERNAVGGASLDGGLFGSNRGTAHIDPLALARAVGRSTDPGARQLAAESYVLTTVEDDLRRRVISGLAAGALLPAAGSILKLYTGTRLVRSAEIALEISGSRGVADNGDDPDVTRVADDFLTARWWDDRWRYQRDPAQHHQ